MDGELGGARQTFCLLVAEFLGSFISVLQHLASQSSWASLKEGAHISPVRVSFLSSLFYFPSKAEGYWLADRTNLKLPILNNGR